MIATLRAMALGFLRDRGALAMSVILPVLVFVVFAAIFSGASGESARIATAVVDERQSAESRRLVDALRRDPRLDARNLATAAEARHRVAAGSIDAALIVRADGRGFEDLSGDGPAPLEVHYDPVRRAAAQIVAGVVQSTYFAALPDVALKSLAQVLGDGFVEFTPAQRDTLDRRFAELSNELTRDAADGRPSEGGLLDGLVAVTPTGGAGQARNHVAYYAGAIAMLFLLFSAVHGAVTLVEERESGILDRILAGPTGIGSLVAGKFLFLVVQGTAQVSIILMVAWIWYQVPVGDHLAGVGLVTVAAATAAAGLALALTSAARTRRQAQTVANVLILLMSALGGSMVPRFLMPPFLQQLGWFTPTTWAVEGYSALLWRGESVAGALDSVLLLLGAGLAGLLVAWVLARRWDRR